jgi:hypothetical protein
MTEPQWTLERIRSLMKEISVGPWQATGGDLWAPNLAHGLHGYYDLIARFHDPADGVFKDYEANSAFVAQAPSIIEHLLQERAVLLKLVQEMHAHADKFDDTYLWRRTMTALELLENTNAVHVVRMPEGLDPMTAQLVSSFAAAVAEKLKAAQDKYDFEQHWAVPDWADQCRQELQEHVNKGDPKDVAAYAAFCWWHSWPTALKDGDQQ